MHSKPTSCAINVILIFFICSRATRQVVCNAEGLKAFAKNASQKAAVLAASALIAGVSKLYKLGRVWNR